MSEQGQEETAEVKRAKDEIRAYVDAITEQDSVEWKAYCDHVDFLTAEQNVRYAPFTPERSGISYPELRLGLVSERIQQRTNELPNYKQEFDRVAELVEQLNIAQHENPHPHSTKPNPNELLASTVEYVTTAKVQAIEGFQTS
jgi:hypothetical protein